MIKDTDFIEYFDKDVIRQEELMRILIREDKWINLDELSKEIQWAKKTIRKDLIFLKDILPSGWRILSSKGKGLRLIKPLESSLDSIVYLIRKNTKAFQIFEGILNSKGSSIRSLSKRLFIPYQAARDIVNKIGVHLNKYGLKLHTRPSLKITGNEFAIRAYIIRFYLNIYVQHWPFKRYNQRVILNYLNIFERNMGITLFKGDKHRLAVSLYVLMKRNRIKKHLNMPQKDIDLLKGTQLHEAFSKVVPIIEKDNGISFSDHEVVYFTVLLIGSKYAYIEKEVSTKRLAERMRNRLDISYAKAHEFIDSLEKHLRIPLWGDDEFLCQLSLCFRRILFHFKIYSPDLVVNSPKMITDCSLIKIIKTKYKNVFRTVKEQCEIFFDEYKREVPDEEVAIITLHIEAIKMSYNLKPVKILLHIAENHGMYRYVYAWLKKHFRDKIEIIPFSKKDLKDIAKYNNNSLIVSNIYMTIETTLPIIKVSNLPTNRDKQSLQKFIMDYYERQGA